MLRKKAKCSDAIASTSSDVFTEAKQKIQQGLDEICLLKAIRFDQTLKLEAELKVLKEEIAKDEVNIQKLESKLKALDNLI